jgi:putative oxidoreductase
VKIAALISRVLLGIAFTVFGLNGFLQFIPQGPMPTGQAGQFMVVFFASHYYVPVFAVQLVCGILFLVNRYVALALTLIAPVIFNILVFHLLMNPGGIGAGALVTLLWIILAWSHRAAFAGILQK